MITSPITRPITSRIASAIAGARVGGVSYDYYVDSVNGNDANDGRSVATAFATLGKAQTEAVSFGDGVRIGLVAGSDFNITSADFSSVDRLYISGVGDLASDGLPLIRSDDAVGAWSDSTDRADGNTNVYSQDLAIVSTGMPLILEDGTPLQWVSSVAACQSSAGTFHVTTGDLPVGTYTFYVHPTGSGDPASNGKTYRHTKGAAPMFGDYATLKFIKFGSQTGRNGVSGGVGALIESCLFANTSAVHDALFGSGTYRNCAGWHDFDDVREGSTALEFYAVDGRGSSVEWDTCVYYAKGGSQAVNGFGGHTSSNSMLYDQATVNDCAIKNCHVDFRSLASALVSARTRAVEGTINCQYQTTATIVDPWFDNSTNLYHVITFGGYPGTVEGARVYADTASAAIRDIANNTEVKRSVFVRRNPGSISSRVIDNSSVTGVLVKGNIFDENTRGAFIYNARLSSLDSESDSNVYFGNVRMNINGTLYIDLASLQAGTGTDANSVTTDPVLADPANGDFTASGTLPAGCGLERLNITYTPIPATLAAAEDWIVGNA